MWITAPARSIWNVFQPHAATCREIGPRLTHPTQELGMILEPIVEPIFLRPEADQDTRRPSVPGDDDFLVRGQPQVT